MTLLALGSVKASPGVTTSAVALGATWPGEVRVVVAECDPAGGELAAWFGLPADPGLVSLAAASRRAGEAGLVGAHCQRLPGELEVLVGPAAAEQAAAALEIVPSELLASVAADAGWLLVADCGRLDPGTPAAAVLAHAGLLGLVCRPVAAEIGHLAAALPRLRTLAEAVGLLLIGDGPYRPSEIAAALRVELLGTLPIDPRAAGVLGGSAARSKALRHTALLRAARGLAGQLGDRLAAPHAPPDGSTPIPGEYRAAGQSVVRGGRI